MNIFKRVYTFRKCFECTRSYPLILFKKDNRKYQVAYYKNHMACCRFCGASKVFSGKIVIMKDEKHKVVEIDPNWINAIKHFFNLPTN